MMLSAGDVAMMRDQAESGLPDTAQIQRRTSVSDGAGGWTDAWSDVRLVACRVAPIGGGESAADSRVDDTTTHVITLPALTDVTDRDRIMIDDRAYDVTLVRARGSWELSRRVEVRQSS